MNDGPRRAAAAADNGSPLATETLPDLPGRDDFLTAVTAVLDGAPPWALEHGTDEDGGKWRACEAQVPATSLHCSLTEFPDGTRRAWISVTGKYTGKSASLTAERDGTAWFQSELDALPDAGAMVRQAGEWATALARPGEAATAAEGRKQDA